MTEQLANDPEKPTGIIQKFQAWLTSGMATLVFFFLSVYAIYRAIRLRWVCDDAFISFRYARNLAKGQGLVFNAGEYVEGFTNLLWTLVLTPFAAAELDLVVVSQLLGVLCYSALLIDYWRQGRRLIERVAASAGPAVTRAMGPWPWSIAAIAVHYHLHVFATSGLETAMFTMLIFSGLIRVALAETPESGLRFAFVLLSCACLTRPDGLLLYGIAGLFALIRFRTRSLKTIVWLHLPFVILVGGSFVFRWFYYGDLLPNTFYAKSAHDPYPAQGFIYAGLYFAAYWLLAIFWIALVVAAVRAKENARWPLVLLATTSGAWILYVVYVGGDFMFARFLVPITPVIAIGGELAMRGLRRGRWYFAFAICLVATLLRYDPYRGREYPVIAYVGEEHKIYTREGMQLLRETARATRVTMQAANPIVAFVGAQAALIYYWDIETAIEAQTGLTDRQIARQTLDERGWIGHEKIAPMEYLKERGVAFILRPPPPERRNPQTNVLRIDGLPGEFEVLELSPHVRQVLATDPRFHLPGGDETTGQATGDQF